MSRLVVIEHDGKANKVCRVVESTGYNEGTAVRYMNGDRKADVVYVGRDYVPVKVGRLEVIYKVKGNNSAAVLCPTDRDCPGEDLSSLVRSHVMGVGYKSLYEKAFPWMWLAIGLIVAVIAVVVFLVAKGFIGTG